jgi:hypothetical protein
VRAESPDEAQTSEIESGSDVVSVCQLTSTG